MKTRFLLIGLVIGLMKKVIKEVVSLFSFFLLIIPLYSSYAQGQNQTLTLPTQEKSKPNKSLNELKEIIHSLNKKIGGFPPKFTSAEDKADTFKLWSDSLVDAKASMKNQGETEQVLWTLSELYRQGHNMDVANSAVMAGKTIDNCLVKFANSIPCNFSATYYYLSISPTQISLHKAKQSLDSLRKLVSPQSYEDIESGYVFLYVYQGDTKSAIDQIDKFSEFFPNSQSNSSFQKIKAGLLVHAVKVKITK